MTAALVQHILAAHGGQDAWRNTVRLYATCSMGGMDFATRMQPAPLREAQVSVATTRVEGQVAPFGGAGDCGYFDAERAWIEDRTGETVAERDMVAGGRGRLWWDRVDALYQAGLIVWFALNIPGLLLRRDVRVDSEGRSRVGGQQLERLRLVLPDRLAIQGAEHLLYADSMGLIRRVDSRSMLYGGIVSVSQVLERHETFDGLLVATRRSYYPTMFTGSPWQVARLVWLHLDDVGVSRKQSAG